MALATIESIVKRAQVAYRPDKKITPYESAKRYLKVDTGGVVGAWDESLTPYMIEPMLESRSRYFDTVGFQGPARSGKTASLLAICVHCAISEASKVLIVAPTKDKGEKWSKEELRPAFDNCHEIKQLKTGDRADYNISFMRFSNGSLFEIVPPLDSSFRGVSRKVVLIYDYDNLRAVNEGNAYELSLKRLASYGSLGTVFLESSPGGSCPEDVILNNEHECATRAEAGIGKIYMQGDRRRWYWQCPDCNEWFIPSFERLVFDRNETDPVKASQHVVMGCPHCGSVIEESEKRQLNLGGKWLKQGQTIDKDGVIHGEGLKSTTASFWLPGPVAAFAKWGRDFAAAYIKAKAAIDKDGDHDPMMAFYNTTCGEIYRYTPETAEDIDHLIANRRDALPRGIAPDDTKFLLASVDVQNGKNSRFIVQVHAFNEGMAQTIIDRFEISQFTDEDGNITQVKTETYAKHWDLLTSLVLDKWYPLGDDREISIRMLAYDTNGEKGTTDNAYAYLLSQPGVIQKRLMPIKGANKPQADRVKTSFIKHPNGNIKPVIKNRRCRGLNLYLLDTNRLKDSVHSALSKQAGEPDSMIFSKAMDDAALKEFLAEERNESGKWEKKDGQKRNESLDLSVYVMAALEHTGLNRAKLSKPLLTRTKRNE